MIDHKLLMEKIWKSKSSYISLDVATMRKRNMSWVEEMRIKNTNIGYDKETGVYKETRIWHAFILEKYQGNKFQFRTKMPNHEFWFFISFWGILKQLSMRTWGHENIGETYLTKPPWECEGKERADEESNSFSFCHNFRFNLVPWLSQHDDCHFSLLFFIWRRYILVYIVEVSLVLWLYGIFSEMLSTQTEKGWI